MRSACWPGLLAALARVTTSPARPRSDVQSPCCPTLCAQVERLSDNRQEVRQAACNLMLEVLQVWSAAVCPLTGCMDAS